MCIKKTLIYTLYFGDQSEFYHSKLSSHEAGEYCGFSVSGFFLGFVWMLYRKMYREFAIVLGLVILYYISIEFLYELNVLPRNIFHLLDGLSMFVIPLFFGFFGNKLYVMKAVRAVGKLETSSLSEEEKHAKAKKTGGVSWLSSVVFILIVFGLSAWENRL